MTVTAPNPAGTTPPAANAQLLEQLMQIARISALEEMASGIAHELNQPIGAIATFAQAAQRMLSRPDPMISSVAEVLQHISDEALNAGQGIHHIRRRFAACDRGRSTCHLSDVFGELIPVLQMLAARSGVKLCFSIAGELPTVTIDPLRIQHVLLTLVQNALDARRTEITDPSVRIEVTGDRYAITTSVIDHGTGIAEAVRANLFRPFFTTKPNGMGLGLASSRAILEAHQGGYRIRESRAPRREILVPPAGCHRRTLPMNCPVNKETGRKPTIYIVDDDDGMRRALSILMTTVGYDAVAFARPGEFLTRFNANLPSCLVLDVRMPEMSGLEVQQQLNRSGAMLPVILVTGHGDIPMAVQAMKDGAFDFLQKPFRDQDLLDRINAALRQDAENRATVDRHADLKRREESLTPREHEVLAMVVDGRANKVIAIDLGLSERTVEIHRANVMEKMGARSVAHLVKMHLTLTGQV